MAALRAACALALAVIALLASGCGVLNESEGGAEDTGLPVYQGKGLKAAYPKGWAAPAKDRRLFPDADFEVASPDARSGLPNGTFAVFVLRKEQSVKSLADHYAALTKTQPDGRVLQRSEGDVIGGHPTQEMLRTYSVQTRTGGIMVRQHDVLVRVGSDQIADVRLVYQEAAYTAAQAEIDMVLGAIEVTGDE